MTTLLRTRLTERFGLRCPIVQGGLALLAFHELCAAVSAAGGLGQLTAGSMTPQQLREEIRRVRQLTSRPFAVNFALGHWDYLRSLDVALEEGVPALSITAGNPEPVLRRVRDLEVRSLVLVASVRQARKCEELGADAVIGVGHEGGGHLGREEIGTMVLVPRLVESVSIPVVASGGIGTGSQLAAALCLGAEGVEMGTRFIATAECRAHPNYKQALLEAGEDQTVVMERSLGRPGRALQVGAVVPEILAREARGAGLDELLPLISGRVNARAALEGRLEEGWVWSGQVAGLIHDLPGVARLMERMVAEAEAVIGRLAAGAAGGAASTGGGGTGPAEGPSAGAGAESGGAAGTGTAPAPVRGPNPGLG